MLVRLSLITFLLFPPCQCVGYGSSLLSLLTGNIKQTQRGETLETIDFVKDTVEVVDHDFDKRNAEIPPEDQTDDGLLDTLNLSYAGNMDLSNAVVKVSKIL